MIAAALALAALALATPAPRTATLVAVGDMADCKTTDDSAVARVILRTAGTLALLGDTVYEYGTAAEYRRCYAPVFGRFLGRSRAALGNHEYGTGNADAAIAYFGLPRHGYYSYELGAWHVVVLNSNCRPAGGCEAGSPQDRWLRRDLAAHPAGCTVAYMHHPFRTSGIRGPLESLAPLWRTLARGGADLVLAGHDHHYERFAPMDGMRSFVVGTGGRSHRPVLWRRRGSEVVNFTTFGVLRLTLRPSDYSWRFLPVAGSSFTDAGSARCR